MIIVNVKVPALLHIRSHGGIQTAEPKSPKKPNISQASALLLPGRKCDSVPKLYAYASFDLPYARSLADHNCSYCLPVPITKMQPPLCKCNDSPSQKNQRWIPRIQIPQDDCTLLKRKRRTWCDRSMYARMEMIQMLTVCLARQVARAGYQVEERS